MTYEQLQALNVWANDIQERTEQNQTIRSVDLIHDIFGILANAPDGTSENHFLPRLIIQKKS
jgi:hypothetical protein